MPTSTPPPSISLWDSEVQNRYADPDLDLDYIDTTAHFIASALAEGKPVEAAFQPGDGTRYNLVLIPATTLATAPPRRDWERHALVGIRRYGTDGDAPADTFYNPNAGLVVWVDVGTYAFNFDDRLSADYVAQKFRTTIVSGCTLAILFRAIAYHIPAAQRVAERQRDVAAALRHAGVAT